MKDSIWIDYMAGCDAPFFSSILKDLNAERNYKLYHTARKHAETIDLLKAYEIDAKIIGEHDVSSRLTQISSFLKRTISLSLKVPNFDYSLSLANIYAVIASIIRGKQSISIIDNDLVEYERTLMEKIAARIHAKATWIIAPTAYPVNLTIEKGALKNHVFTFDGYKEDIYIADHILDRKFLEKIPFKDYVVIRPEALYSTYVHDGESITPELLNLFSESELNVIYLPRTVSDMEYIDNIRNKSNIWIPPNPLKGLDLVYYSKGILTGSGTFAREGACMGQTAVSFFPDKLLAVDKKLVDNGKIFHSRDPEKIVSHVISNLSKPRRISFENSKRVKQEFMDLFEKILEEG